MRLEVYSHYSFPKQWGDAPGTIPIYIDDWITKANKKGIAILVEPRSIYPGVYEHIKSHYNDFKYVFTHDEEILKLPNAKLLLYGTVNVGGVGKKTRAVSMICSKKELCEGHKARKMVANALKDKIRTLGEFDGGEWVEDLAEVYKPYKFNVAMENFSGGYYFTEKICNCFSTMTVPIYYGSPQIDRFFNSRGIIIARTPEEVIQKTEDLLARDIDVEYKKRIDAIIENYRRVQIFKDWKILFLQNYGEMLREDFKE